MIKHYCDICGKLMNPKTCTQEDDPDDYTWGPIDVELGVWFNIEDICKGCGDKLHDITKDDVMDFIKNKCCGSGADGENTNC